VPSDTEPIEHPLLPHIYGQRIADVVQAPADWPSESLYLVLENGYLVYDMMAAPHGTGGAGVYFLAPGKIDPSRFKSIWK
jgi:hypothetical protein